MRWVAIWLIIWKRRPRRSGTSEGGRCRFTWAIETAVVWLTWTWDTGWRLEGESFVPPGRRRRMDGVGVVY